MILLESCMFKKKGLLILNTAFIFSWYFQFNNMLVLQVCYKSLNIKLLK